MTTKRQTIISISLIVGVLLVAITATLYIVISQSKQIRSEARSDLFGSEEVPAVYTDLRGNPIDLESYAGRVLVINSWASWSPLSYGELIILQKLATEFKDSPVTFLAINRKEPKEQAERFVQTLPALTDVTIVIDISDQFYSAVEGYAMPETIIYNNDGTTRTHVRGTFNEEELRQAIKDSLENA